MTVNFAHGGNVFTVARSMGIAPEEIQDFSASINPLGMAPGVKGAVLAALDRAVHYPDDDALELRESLARYHQVSVGQVAVANGSTELIYLLPRLMQGRRALIIAPPFGEYARSLERNGWECGYFELKPDEEFALDIKILTERLREGWDALFLCNPNNPTGRLFLRHEVSELLEACRNAGVFLVLDEAFIDFREEESAKHLLVRTGGGIVLRSMTKFFAIPGLRLGYALAAEDVIGRMAGLREPWSVNTPAQAAGLAALTDTEYRTRTRAVIEEERSFLFSGIAAINGFEPYPSAANYLLVRIDKGPSAAELRDRLLAGHILIRDCANFRGLDSRFFRIAVRTHEENGRLLAALREI